LNFGGTCKGRFTPFVKVGGESTNIIPKERLEDAEKAIAIP